MAKPHLSAGDRAAEELLSTSSHRTTNGQRREKVSGKVLMLDRSLEDTLPYLFALLGIEEQPSPLQQMDPQIRRDARSRR